MNDTIPLSGHCLCGAVKLRVRAVHEEVDVCHCAMCRRWSGGPWMGMPIEPDIDIEGREHVRVYRSSEWAERAFCGVCGSHLYWHVVEKGVYYLSAGVLDDQSQLRLHMQLFIDDKPAYYDLAGDAPRLTGREVLALYAPERLPEDER